MNPSLLRLMLPEIVLTVAALGIMLWDLWLPTGKKTALTWAAMAVCLVLFAITFLPDVESPYGVLSDSFVMDPLAVFFKRAFCVAGFLVLLMSREYIDSLPQGQGEFCTLTLLALLGMFLCSSVNDFMSLFVSIEVVTVSFFVLAAFRRERATSVEAGLKLLVIGSMSAAILLYGIAFVYGATGEVSFSAIRSYLAQGRSSYELIFGAVMIFLGLGFKTSAVPLHVWVPDVYQGAPTPVTAFLSVGSKLAGFVLVVRCLSIFAGPGSTIAPELTAFFALVAAATLIYGNLGAIPQSNIKRLMGYSSIAQCGYILVGIAAVCAGSLNGNMTGLTGALFYMAAYVVTNLAAFAVVLVVAKATGSHEIDDYAGLAKRNPLLGAAFACALLSLAGVPPFIGFFGKFLLLGSAFDLKHPELLWVGAIGLVTVVIALYYYLGVAKRIYVFEPRTSEPLVVPARMKVTLVVAMALLIAGGIAPRLLTESAARVVATITTSSTR